MECFEARTLKKSSFLSEFASQLPLIDDFFSINGVINDVSDDDFSIDVFLDFSNGSFSDEFLEPEEEEKESLSRSSQEREDKFSGARDSEFLPVGDLSVPVDDIENLEWLSQIVDDSASELSLLCPAGNNYIPKPETTGSQNRYQPPVHTSNLLFPLTVPAKPRTKRPRTGGRSWSGGSSESSGDFSPTSTLLFSNLTWNSFHVGFENRDCSEEVEKPPPAKRGRKRLAAVDDSGDASLLVQRRCSHCQVQKTPQWRNGPLGPKTLCNACGVRFKSGRLFPEYRPACSPTFSGDVHSNSHRKVLEMRRTKEGTVVGEERNRV